MYGTCTLGENFLILFFKEKRSSQNSTYKKYTVFFLGFFFSLSPFFPAPSNWLYYTQHDCEDRETTHLMFVGIPIVQQINEIYRRPFMSRRIGTSCKVVCWATNDYDTIYREYIYITLVDIFIRPWVRALL